MEVDAYEQGTSQFVGAGIVSANPKIQLDFTTPVVSSQNIEVSASRKKLDFGPEPIVIDSLKTYISTLTKLLQNHDFTAAILASPLLSISDAHVHCDFLRVEHADFASSAASELDNFFLEIVSAHLGVIFYATQEEWLKAYTMQVAIVTSLHKEIVVKLKTSNWYLPLLYTFCSDLLLLAKKAQAAETSRRSGVNYGDNVASLIMAIYRSCVADTRTAITKSKKVAIFPLTLLLFQSYFDSNKMALLKPLIRSVDNLYSGFIARLTAAELVTYNFYLGKKATFDSDLETANKALTYAFDHCPDQHLANKRRILIYLIPVRMFLGEMPSDELLGRYNMGAFKAITEGFRDGNIRLLREGINTNRQFLLESGVYLMFERLAQLTYLALFKRIHSIVGGYRIKLDMFVHVLQFLGEDIHHVDEVFCSIANLITRGLIRGYISRTHNLVVLSKKNPY